MAARQPRDLRRPSADGMLGNETTLEAAGERRALGTLAEAAPVRRLLEQGGPDGFEDGLSADQGEETGARGGRVASPTPLVVMTRMA